MRWQRGRLRRNSAVELLGERDSRYRDRHDHGIECVCLAPLRQHARGELPIKPPESTTQVASILKRIGQGSSGSGCWIESGSSHVLASALPLALCGIMMWP